MHLEKNWQKLERSIEHRRVLPQDAQLQADHVHLKIKENQNNLEVEAIGVDPAKISTSIEKGYLFIRWKKEGLGKWLPQKGRVIRQVFLPFNASQKDIKVSSRKDSVKVLLRRS